jgi:hypothetical protein
MPPRGVMGIPPHPPELDVLRHHTLDFALLIETG